MRDLLGELEDKFFATVFFGSGIILVVMMFVWAAAYGVRVYAVHRFDLDQNEGRAPLGDHRHLHRGRAVLTVRRRAEMGPDHFSCLGAAGKHHHSHLELPV